jgi:DNA-binding NtrC family response regulator
MPDPRPLIAVLHEDEKILAALESLLESKGYLPITFTSAERSLSFIRRNGPVLVLSQKPALVSDGLAYLEQIKRVSSSTEGIFLPSPLTLDAEGILTKTQADGIVRIVERLLSIATPEYRRSETRAFQTRIIGA